MLSKRSERGKEEAKERDRERKREKRSQLTPDQQDQVRLLDRERWHKRRKNMSSIEVEKVRAKDRERKSCEFVKAKKRRNRDIVNEIKRINESLRKRLIRSLLSDEDRKKSRDKARIEMASSRKNGFLRRKYKQRTKRDPNKITLWKNFFRKVNLDLFICENPRLKSLHNKLNSMNKEVKEMEDKRRQEAQMYARMPTWTPGREFKQKLEESRGVCQKIKNMRKHRKKIKEVIKDYEKLRKTLGQESNYDSSSTDDFDGWSDSDHASEHGDIDVYS